MEQPVQLNLDGLGIELVSSDFTPPVGLRGVYSFREPFKSRVGEAIHTCTDVRKLSSLIKAGEDVYKEYYQPYGISEDEYDQDIQLDKCIVTIRSDGGSIVHFPVGYLEAYPNMNGVVYLRRILQIGLAPFPRDTNFTLLANELREVVQRHLGYAGAHVSIAQASDLQLVSNEAHMALQAQRDTIKEIPTPQINADMWRQRYEDMLRQRDELLALVEQQP